MGFQTELPENLAALLQQGRHAAPVLHIYIGLHFRRGKQFHEIRPLDEPAGIGIVRPLKQPLGRRQTVSDRHVRRAEFFRERSLALEDGEVLCVALREGGARRRGRGGVGRAKDTGACQDCDGEEGNFDGRLHKMI